jgi:curli biogenesis system outer membrane secretion channel CsgG
MLLRRANTMPRILSFFVCLGLAMFAGDAAAQQKKRVAILSFDDAAVEASAARAVGTTQDVGGFLADVVVKELLKGSIYTVVERRAIDQVLKEQNFSNSNRADPKTAAAIGRVLGVDAIIVGSVTQFGIEESAVALGSGTVGRLTRGVLGAGKRVNNKATVGMTARMVDTKTGEVLTAASGSGESSKASVAASGYTTGNIDLTSRSFQESMLGEAVNSAAAQVAAGLNEFGSKLAAAPVDYTGLVADVSGNTLIVNVGKLKGVQVGDTIEISRAGRQILDPQTKKVLRTIVDRIGTAKVTEVDDGSATATLSGPAAVQVGDQVKRAP